MSLLLHFSLQGIVALNTSTEPVLIAADDNPRTASHGKRQINLLPYDPTGLRTTKTATWEALDAVLAARAKPNHLVVEEWAKDYDAMCADREAKGLPAPVGRRQKFTVSSNYNRVSW
jgi:hypothetical protein